MFYFLLNEEVRSVFKTKEIKQQLGWDVSQGAVDLSDELTPEEHIPLTSSAAQLQETEVGSCCPCSSCCAMCWVCTSSSVSNVAVLIGVYCVCVAAMLTVYVFVHHNDVHVRRQRSWFLIISLVSVMSMYTCFVVLYGMSHSFQHHSCVGWLSCGAGLSCLYNAIWVNQTKSRAKLHRYDNDSAAYSIPIPIKSKEWLYMWHFSRPITRQTLYYLLMKRARVCDMSRYS